MNGIQKMWLKTRLATAMIAAMEGGETDAAIPRGREKDARDAVGK